MTKKIEDILAEYADGLSDGSVTTADLIKKYDIIAGSDDEALLQLAAQLEAVLVQVAPSPEFVTQLRHELLTGSPQRVLERLRTLSASKLGQLAAGLGVGGVTVAAGVLFWYWSRREKFNPLALDSESVTALAS
jgi:hypothetical protein